MPTKTPFSLTPDQLETKDFAGTVVAFLGNESLFHQTIFNASLANMAAVHPEFADWQCISVECNDQNVYEVVKTLHKKKVWAVILTRPLKSAVLPMLMPDYTRIPTAGAAALTNESLGSADDVAERVGAANFLLWRPTGYAGVSTDGEAFASVLDTQLKYNLRGKIIVVLGSGAMARAVGAEALRAGCRELWMGGRNQDNIWNAMDKIAVSPMIRMRLHSFNPLKPSAKTPKNALIVNTLPLSVRGEDEFDITRFDKTSIYFDVSLIPSTMQQKAAAHGMVTCCGGKELLAFQMCKQIELATGKKPDNYFVSWVVADATNAKNAL